MTGTPRVVILGGGMAGLAAAWRLSEPGWGQQFSAITVLERGHRLGGKGASSRGCHGRIEEHGLHVWLGHYDNAFRVIRECYAELDRQRSDPHCPIRTWRDAFFPAGQLGLFDRGPSGWVPWVATFSSNPLLPGAPGVDGRAPSLAELVARSGLLLRDFYASLDVSATLAPAVTLSLSPSPPSTSPYGVAFRALADTLLAVSRQLLLLAGQGTRLLAGPAAAAAIDATFAPLLSRLAPVMGRNMNARRLHALIDLVRGTLSGMAADGLGADRDAYDAINHLDLRDWLRKHGAQPSTLQSAIVRGQYDLAFSYEHGDPSRPQFAAGWAVFGSTKLWFDYKGAFFWKMRAGMGDVVFAPLYQALLARGVQFQFFSSVEQLVPSADGSGIKSVVIDRSAPFAAGSGVGSGEYQPLVTVKGLPCFPSEPDHGQHSVQRQVLTCGEDFDLLVFAIPPGMARHICGPLAAQRPEWRNMLDRIGTVATHAFQVWLKPDERSLGWAHHDTTMSAFVKPFDTWASMSHLLEFEDWGDVGPPRTVGYFCGALPKVPGADAAACTRDQAIRFLQHHSRRFWPYAVDPDTQNFRWDLLCAESDVTGPDRFDTQYWTANTDPSDQYVQSLPDTDQYRLRPDGSGYRNLVLAGDWTDCGYNAGNIEAAAVSGLQAANTLLGRPRWNHISGLYLR
ncbi:MAG TPA: FAD-dependent oxidoreductase [Pseudonocardiaceae bacterium]|nr:FAD-dependent oxidoreductase [Pseudonocardiaceae bacterium]